MPTDLLSITDVAFLPAEPLSLDVKQLTRMVSSSA